MKQETNSNHSVTPDIVKSIYNRALYILTDCECSQEVKEKIKLILDDSAELLQIKHKHDEQTFSGLLSFVKKDIDEIKKEINRVNKEIMFTNNRLSNYKVNSDELVIGSVSDLEDAVLAVAEGLHYVIRALDHTTPDIDVIVGKVDSAYELLVTNKRCRVAGDCVESGDF